MRRLLLVGPYLLVVLAGAFGFNRLEDQNDKLKKIIVEQTAQSLDRRIADCKAMDDVGVAIKAGVAVLPDDPRLAEFVTLYNAAIDAAIVTAKTRKGYSADCSQIGSPPKPGG